MLNTAYPPHMLDFPFELIDMAIKGMADGGVTHDKRCGSIFTPGSCIPEECRKICLDQLGPTASSKCIADTKAPGCNCTYCEQPFNN